MLRSNIRTYIVEQDNIVIPANPNRRSLSIVSTSGTSTVELGTFGAAIPLVNNNIFEPRVIPTGEVVIRTTGTCIITTEPVGTSILVQRLFATFDGVNRFGTIPEWTATGDFDIGFDVSGQFPGETKVILGNTSKDTDFVALLTNGVIRLNLDGVNTDFTTIPIVEGKNNTVLLERSSTTLTVTVNGAAESKSIGTQNLDITTVAAGLISTRFYAGVIANLSLTDTAGGDNRFYPMSGGRFGGGAYELDSLATLGAEELTNTEFNDLTGWTDQSLGTGSIAAVGGNLELTAGVGGGADRGWAETSYTGTADRIVLTVGAVTGGTRVRVGSSSLASDYHDQVAEEGSILIEVAAGSVFVSFYNSTASTTTIVARVSVKEAPNAMLLNNFISSDWELFTQVGDDWLGVERTHTLLSDWPIKNAAVTQSVEGTFDVNYSGAFTNILRDSAMFKLGDVVKWSVTASTTSGGMSLFIGNASVVTINANAVYGGTDAAAVTDGRVQFASSAFTGSLTDLSFKRILEAP